jgi:effector-binding domain-containing protein
MIETPELVKTTAQLVATIHIETPRSEIQNVMGPGIGEAIADAWHDFAGWIEANGYTTAEDLYECYIVGPESSPDPADWCTELSRPVIE